MEFNFEKLEVWQKAVQYYVDTCKASENFPRSELFGLTAQLRNSALSISLNIAEGAGRQYKKEFKQFLGVARGSLFETITNLHACRKRQFLSESDFQRLYKEGVTIGKMTNALRKSLN